MKKIKPLILLFLIALFFISCNKNDDKIKFTFLQLNDVYEIAALEGGEVGGMDRVETLHQKLLKENPNTFMFMAGDFLNPSLLGNIKYEGERIKGKHMIEVMNAMHFDLVAFGNHEFDLSEKILQERINSSNFQWIATNLKHNIKGELSPFYQIGDSIKTEIPKTVIFDLKDNDGTEIQIGFFSATINSNPKPYVTYSDFYEDAKNAYNNLSRKTDLVFGLTHLKISQDKMLANMLPKVPLIMGGHEHTNMLIPVGQSVITKADANAKTVYVHRFEYDKKTKELRFKSELIAINSKLDSDKHIASIIEKWQLVLDKKIAEYSPNAHDIIFVAKTPLNGEDHAVRSMQTNLGELITKAMVYSYGNKVDGIKLDGALVNGGSIRLDDMLTGNITGVDIFRVLPFGGSVLKVEIKGFLLKKVLNYGRIKSGTGAYLQRFNFEYDKSNKLWSCSGNPINDDKIYIVAFSDYLLKGYDIPFLNSENKDVKNIYYPNKNELSYDIRMAIINYLKSIDS